MPFLRQGSQAFCEETNPFRKNRQFLGLCFEYFSLCSDDVPNIKLLESLVRKALEHVFSYIYLNLALLILNMEKSALSKIPEGYNPSSNREGGSLFFQIIVAHSAKTLGNTCCINIGSPTLGVCVYANTPKVFFFIFSDCYQLIDRFHIIILSIYRHSYLSTQRLWKTGRSLPNHLNRYSKPPSCPQKCWLSRLMVYVSLFFCTMLSAFSCSFHYGLSFNISGFSCFPFCFTFQFLLLFVPFLLSCNIGAMPKESTPQL